MKPTSAMNTRTGVTDFAHQRPVLVAKDKTLTRTIAIRPSDQRISRQALLVGRSVCRRRLPAAGHSPPV